MWLAEKSLELEFQKQVLTASIRVRVLGRDRQSFPPRQYDSSYIIIFEDKDLLILGTAS